MLRGIVLFLMLKAQLDLHSYFNYLFLGFQLLIDVEIDVVNTCRQKLYIKGVNISFFVLPKELRFKGFQILMEIQRGLEISLPSIIKLLSNSRLSIFKVLNTSQCLVFKGFLVLFNSFLLGYQKIVIVTILAVVKLFFYLV